MSQPKLVVLTSGSENGRKFTNMLFTAGIPYELVTLCPPLPKKKRQQSFLCYTKRRLIARLRGVNFLRELAQKRRTPYPVSPTYAGNIGGARLVNILREKQPDYVLMMGGGILPSQAISAVGMGVLNAHPGLLPRLRGVDVIRHAALKDLPIAVTGHYINQGIDTGPVIARYLLSVRSGGSYSEICFQADRLCLAVMYDMVERLCRGEELKGDVCTQYFSLCRRLGEEDSCRADRILASERPFSLYESWRRYHPEIGDGALLLEKYEGLLENEGS